MKNFVWEMDISVETTRVVRGNIGAVNEFKLGNNWKEWVKIVGQFYIVNANDLVSTKEVPIFLVFIKHEADALLLFVYSKIPAR